MTIERHMINKSYYETFLERDEQKHPIEVLGALRWDGHKNEISDGSYIRFAQGEVYYHSKDFEAAIFKWEQVRGELAAWARKNIADAYFELGSFPEARDLYTSIETDDETLVMEAALQLFSLYVEQQMKEEAFTVIQKAVALNPDYPNVTAVARSFYEKQQDWSSAVQLAVAEAVRTRRLHWFDIVKGYADDGRIRNMAPELFSNTLLALHSVDEAQFAKTAISFWNAYEESELYVTWIERMNAILSQLEIASYDCWDELAALYENTYCALIDGEYAIRDLYSIIPDHVTNWLRLVKLDQALLPSAAILAWEELFPLSIDPSAIEDARTVLIQASGKIDGLAYGVSLFQSIQKWARSNDLDTGLRMEWWVRELTDMTERRLLVAGAAGSGKSSVVHSVLGETIIGSPTSVVTVVRGGGYTEALDITDTGIQLIDDIAYVHDMSTGSRSEDACLYVTLPNSFLQEQALAFIDTPGFTNEGNETLSHLSVADGILFVLNAGMPLTDYERTILSRLQEVATGVPIHFLLNKMDTVYGKEEARRIVEETKARIRDYAPDANVIPYSALYATDTQKAELGGFLRTSFRHVLQQEKRAERLLSFMRTVIQSVLKQRADKERDFVESMKWNEDMSIKLNGTIHNLRDMEKETIQTIITGYRAAKEAVQAELAVHIPKLLKECADFIGEDSDFKHLHRELNSEMNERVRAYLEKTVLPSFYDSLQLWIAASRKELNESQAYLDEICETFNAMYGEDMWKLACDFKILDDWRRDADRTTSGVHMDDVNILLRFTPSQFLLKSAGKLLGALPQNKMKLHSKYKKYVEDMDYTDVTAVITSKFLLQFELFEKSLERDITMFFKNPFSALSQAVENAHLNIQDNRAAISKMKSKPERFHDPLQLFDLRFRQYTWMTSGKKDLSGTAVETELV